MKIAVVTPSFGTPADYLARCLSSVATQTAAATHFLVCDGDAPSVQPPPDVKLMCLPGPHGDNGNFARAIGSVAAIAEEFDAIAYLDSDNWFAPRHIESLVRLHDQTGAVVCTSGRYLYDLDGVLLGPCAEVDGERFADTSCMMFFPPAFELVSEWYRMPKPLSPICDRVVWDAIKRRKLTRSHSAERTLHFTSRYAVHYRRFGRTPPPGAKELTVDATVDGHFVVTGPSPHPATTFEPEAIQKAPREENLRRLAAQDPKLRREAWVENPPPANDELASIIIPCCNLKETTRRCLESILRNARMPFELIVVDNGSTDGTSECLFEYEARIPSERFLKRFEIVRNESNRGYSAACNQGLALAQGDYLILLHNDTILTQDSLERLIACSRAQWPRVGMVGPMSNGAPAPQFTPVEGCDPDILSAFAHRRALEYAGKALHVRRLTGFCLLVRREVYEQVGGFDERFGFFEDDDLCFRAYDAGFELLVALDVFVYHHGGMTFEGSGIDIEPLLRENFEKFRARWGAGRTTGYTPPQAIKSGQAALSTTVSQARHSWKVSLCMIVKNEERNLPECLESVAGIADEIVVVDTGSTDRTRQIALDAGAKIAEFPWIDDFAAARNESLNHATGDWVFWMDADDRLDAENRDRLKRLLANLPNENVGLSMKCLCLPDLETGTATVVDHVRLFRNDPRIRWKYRIHEQILVSIKQAGGEIRWSDVVIHHTGYQDGKKRVPKLERDARLLKMDLAGNPEEPFTLFNLGWTTLKLGGPADALPFLEKSLRNSHPGDSIVRKTYALLAQCHVQLGDLDRALGVCRDGRRIYPDDDELLFEEGTIHLEQSYLAAAEASFRMLVDRPVAGKYFASVDPDFRRYKARHFLGVIRHKQNRLQEAIDEWQLVLNVRPDYVPTLVSIGETRVQQSEWAAVDEIVHRLEGVRGGRHESWLLRARTHMARKEFDAAKRILNDCKISIPDSLAPRILYSHALLQEDKDLDAAERALRDILSIVPNHRPTLHNLAVLLQKRGSLGSLTAPQATAAETDDRDVKR